MSDLQLNQSSSDFTDYLLAEFRCAYLRAKLLENEICAMGVAMKGGWISPDEALAHLSDCGALALIGPNIITASSTH